jgi:hypothetical protein
MVGGLGRWSAEVEGKRGGTAGGRTSEGLRSLTDVESGDKIIPDDISRHLLTFV